MPGPQGPPGAPSTVPGPQGPPGPEDLRAFGIHTPQDYGAVANGTTDDSGAFAAAKNAVIAAGGGTLLVPPGIYAATLSIDASDPVHVLGYGATLQPPGDWLAVVVIAQGYGVAIKAAQVEGLTIRSNGHAGTTALQFKDTDGAAARNLYISSCNVGIDFLNNAAGSWNERSAVSDSFIYSCTTGILFHKASGNPSFNEVALTNVGISGCVTGIDQQVGTDFTRTTWDNVTIWPAQNGTGVIFDGQIDHSRLAFGVEALQTGITGVKIGPNYTYYADAAAHDLRISFVGSFADRVLDQSPDGGITWVDGTQHSTSKYQQLFAGWKDGESYPRFKMNIDGLQFGFGDVTPPIKMLPWYADYMKMQGRYVFDSPASFGMGTGAEPVGGVALDVLGPMRIGSTRLRSTVGGTVEKSADGATWVPLAADTSTLAPINSPTFTGAVTLPGDPGAALQAATKQYVDAHSAVGSTPVRQVSANTTAVKGELLEVNAASGPISVAPWASPATGDTFTIIKKDVTPNVVTFTATVDGDVGGLLLTGPYAGATLVYDGSQFVLASVNVSTPSPAASVPFTKAQADAYYAPTTNPVFAGTVTLGQDPSGAFQAATKQYVDTTINGAGVFANGTVPASFTPNMANGSRQSAVLGAATALLPPAAPTQDGVRASFTFTATGASRVLTLDAAFLVIVGWPTSIQLSTTAVGFARMEWNAAKAKWIILTLTATG